MPGQVEDGGGGSEHSSDECGAEEGARVSVELQRFFSDWRSRAYMWVPTGGACAGKARRVRWLEGRLRRRFCLPACRLLVAGHLLPPDEPLRLLRDGDVLQVIPVIDDQGDELTLDGHKSVEDQDVVGKSETERDCLGAMDVVETADVVDACGQRQYLQETKLRALQALDRYCATVAHSSSADISLALNSDASYSRDDETDPPHDDADGSVAFDAQERPRNGRRKRVRRRPRRQRAEGPLQPPPPPSLEPSAWAARPVSASTSPARAAAAAAADGVRSARLVRALSPAPRSPAVRPLV